MQALLPVGTLIGAHERVYSNPARDISNSANEFAKLGSLRQQKSKRLDVLRLSALSSSLWGTM